MNPGERINQHEHVCNRTLLTLVARGNAILAELNRLIELIPAPFRSNTDLNQLARDPNNERKSTSDNLISDFSYFKNAELFESKIESNKVLKEADEAFCDTFIDLLSRFYFTFESVQKYVTDLNNFILELEEETFIGQSLDGLLVNFESRQLLCEAYFLLGCMLLTTDNNFEGGLREKLIVSYYRYSSHKSVPSSSIDDTCNLMRSTGYRSSQQQIYRATKMIGHHRPEGYPESFFGRVGVSKSVVNLLIAKMQTVDIYNQTMFTFPHPDHRSAALSQQASMLYVILYFCPEILQTQRSRMREITDKFFSDNWVISIGMGELVNLLEAWYPYAAAKESLVQLYEPETLRNLTNNYNLRYQRVSKQIQDYLKEGWLNENSVIAQHSKIINSLRESNVVLKWILLHSQLCPDWQLTQTKHYHSIVVCEQPERGVLYRFLQNLAELENRFSQTCEDILSVKVSKMQNDQLKAAETLQDLIDIFNDIKPMRWVQAGSNKELVNLLVKLKTDLETLDFDQKNLRDTAIKLINDIESARESYSDGKNLQVVQLFEATKDSLINILRLSSIDSNIKVVLRSVSDYSYAWKIMDKTFTVHIQKMIKTNPLEVYGLKSTFLKLTSAFDNCLIRIQQINAQDDLVSVSQYYSTKLVGYIRDVLLVIPASILELVSSIIKIQTDSVINDMPNKVPLDSLKDYALPDERLQMLQLTYKVAHYAECIMLLKDTTIGVIRVDSKQLLEDGIRHKLGQKMLDSIQTTLQFDKSQTGSKTLMADKLTKKLSRLGVIMKGFRQSFEYIQDYLFIYGLRIWQEELRQLVKYDVAQASEGILHEFSEEFNFRNDLVQVDQKSFYSATKKSSSHYASSDSLETSFIMRVLREIISITDPRMTIYEEQTSSWYEQKPPHDKVMNMKVFRLMASSLGVCGLNGVDQICCDLLTVELQKLDNFLLSILTNKSNQALVKLLEAINLFKQQVKQEELPKQPDRLFPDALIKIAPYSDRIANHLLRVGQLLAIRQNIGCILSTGCRSEARNLYSCLDTLNTALLSTIEHSLRHDRMASQQKCATHKSSLSLDKLDDLEHRDTMKDPSLSSSKHICGNIQQQIEDSRCIYELTNHLEWIGLSDPMSKLYTLALTTSDSAQVYESRDKLISMDLIFLVLLDQCSKFHFSRSINGFVPKLSRNFYETSKTVDGQPLFYGLMTLINHYDPYIASSATKQPSAIHKLLELMSLFVKCSLDQVTKPQDLSLEVANMILSIIEIVRLARQPSCDLLYQTFLPKFVLDTFQFTVCHLDYVKKASS